MIETTDILFLGLDTDSPAWYRCYLPALHLGCDWAGVHGEPPTLHVSTAHVKGDTVLPQFADYKVVIIQQPRGRRWLDKINSLRAQGVKVLYEIDDYVHGIRKLDSEHAFRRDFDKAGLAAMELCMRACDGIVCSTEYIARRYRKFGKTYVCRNGLDFGRYNLTRPERSTVNIGWAGATGHLAALVPWVNAVLPVMCDYENTRLFTIGEPGVAQAVGGVVGDARSIGVPFTRLECYPAAMCSFDIALAPAGKGAWYQAKSDLRWLEASALGIPIIADPSVYGDIEDGVTGFHAETPEQVEALLRRLLEDRDLSERVGQQAREHVHAHRSIVDLCLQWYEVCGAVEGGYESQHELRRSG